MFTKKAPIKELRKIFDVRLKVILYDIQPIDPPIPAYIILFLSMLKNITGNILPKNESMVILIIIYTPLNKIIDVAIPTLTAVITISASKNREIPEEKSPYRTSFIPFVRITPGRRIIIDPVIILL